MAFRIKYNAPVILSFSIICSVVYFIDQGLLGKLMPYFTVGTTVNISNPFSIASLFTHVIGHSSMEHLLGNMTFILLLGPIIEEKYGSVNTLIMIAFTAFVTGLINVMFYNTGLLGASGIVFMLILLVSFTNTNSNEGGIPLTFILVAILFVGKELLHSLSADNISQTAHIIGGMCGSVFGFTGVLKKIK